MEYKKFYFNLQNQKLPGQVLVDKPNPGVPNQLDPLLVQMNLHSLQNRIQPPNLHNHLPPSHPASLPPEGLGNPLPGLQQPNMATAGNLTSIPGIHGNMSVNMAPPHGNMDQLPGEDNDALTNFLKNFKQQRQLPLDTMWQKQTNPFNVAPPVSGTPHWQPDVPISMWDLQPPPAASDLPTEQVIVPPTSAVLPTQAVEKEPPQRPIIDETAATTVQKEIKKKKELDEQKQAKKEAEERRKLEQRKQEQEKKMLEEKKKKDEEKIKKELEKAKKEAEDKRLKELEEKRRLKEQRKAEEEARKRTDEQKKEEEDRLRLIYL